MFSIPAHTPGPPDLVHLVDVSCPISMQRRLFGSELFRLRELANLTQDEAAARLGKQVTARS